MENVIGQAERWDAAVLAFCSTRYPLSVEPCLVRTYTSVLNDIYQIVPPDALLSDAALTAIYEQGVVKCYTVGYEAPYGKARLLWRNPNTKVLFMPKEEITSYEGRKE